MCQQYNTVNSQGLWENVFNCNVNQKKNLCKRNNSNTVNKNTVDE